MTDAELVARAEEVAARAYAPYSKYLVGAIAIARDGREFEGVNVENAAYPLGICAEKSALAHAVAESYGPGTLERIVITASPCGGCRQWLHEFRIDRVTFRNNAGEIVTYTPAELLPDTWSSMSEPSPAPNRHREPARCHDLVPHPCAREAYRRPRGRRVATPPNEGGGAFLRSGFIAVAGRPNVGKSTIVNALAGGKVAIVSDKPQTTRRRIFGIANGDDYQLILADLPGSSGRRIT